MTKIEQGAGDAGFVYQTDALASDLAASFDIPAEANVHAVYAGVVISRDGPSGRGAGLPRLAGGP